MPAWISLEEYTVAAFPQARMKKYIMAIALLAAVPAFAADTVITLTTSHGSQNGIYIEYQLDGSSDGVDGMCAILDYDFTEGFYQFAPAVTSRRQVICNGNLTQSYFFTGLESDTKYWLSIYPYKESGRGIQLLSGAIGGKEIATQKADVMFSATLANLAADSAVLTTTRAPQAGEWYGATCTPYAASDDFVQSTSVTIGHLQSNTNYTCRIYVFWSTSDGDTHGASNEVGFTTSSAQPQFPSSSAPPPESTSRSQSSMSLKEKTPTAGFEDEVLTKIETYWNPFPDTDMSQLGGKAALELYRRGVIGGFPDGEFKGNRRVNRAEAVKLLLLARYGALSDVLNSNSFPDVKSGEWYLNFVMTAASIGIIGGYPDGLFRPQNSVNTAEFLKMFALTFELQQRLPYSYMDVQPDDWFAVYAGLAQQYNLFPSRKISLVPAMNLTRKEVAIAIYQYMLNR